MNEFDLDLPDTGSVRIEAGEGGTKNRRGSNSENTELIDRARERTRLVREAAIKKDEEALARAQERLREATVFDADDLPDSKATKLKDIGKGTAKLGLGGGKLFGAGLLFSVLGAFRLTRWGAIKSMTLTDRLLKKVDSFADGLTKSIKNPFWGVKKITDAFGWVKTKLLPEKSLGEYVKKQQEQKKREEKK